MCRTMASWVLVLERVLTGDGAGIVYLGFVQEHGGGSGSVVLLAPASSAVWCAAASGGAAASATALDGASEVTGGVPSSCEIASSGASL